ncbi:MAG: Npt1/Npt2 family nucleotide transporter [Vicinamibacterales bacterium]
MAHPTPPPSRSEPRTLVTHPELKSQHSFPVFRALGEAPKTRLDRALSVFADVRAGEGVGALLLAANVFLLLAAYYLLKPAREALILTEGGAAVASYSSAAQAVLLLGVVPLYGWLGSRVRRIRLVATTAIFFAANLAVFFVVGQAGIREGVAFYVWLGIFNVFIVSQFWAFANDLYTEGQGRRLFPLIGVGASLGAWVGASAVPPLVRNLAFTPYTLMMLAAGLLLVAMSLSVAVHRRERRSVAPEVARAQDEPLGKEGGFQLVLRDRYLLWIGVLVILLNVVNTTGEFLLRSVVERQAAALATGADPVAAQQSFVGAFYGSFYGWVNLLGFLLQLLVASRAIRYLGVRGSLFILPILAFVNYAVIAVVPILSVIRVGKILENGTDYSIQNTVRQALFLPTSREAKYKAKAAIDTFCQRAGDVLQAGLVLGGTSMGFGAGAFAWINVALTGAWLAVAGRIAREHRRRTL